MKKIWWIAGISAALVLCLVPLALNFFGVIDLFGNSGDDGGNVGIVLTGTEVSLSTNFSFVDGKYFIHLPNRTETFTLEGAVLIAEDAAWHLCSDEFGAVKIPSKTVPLFVGDNIYYILVINGEDYTVYPINMRVKPLYTVSFFYNNGEDCPDSIVEEGDSVTLPADLYLRGHKLSYWHDEQMETIRNSVTVTRDMSITAVWEARTYTITYEANIGTLTALTAEVVFGEEFILELPAGNLFNNFYGWYYEGALVEDGIYEFDKNITLTAKWSSTIFTMNNKGLITGLTDFGKSMEHIEIPTENNGMKVVGIADGAFTNRTSISKVTLADTVETIGDFAFSGCLALHTVTIGANSMLSRIGAYAFNNTKWLSMQSGLIYLGKVLYAAIGNISGSVSIKSGTISIAPNAFKGCDQIVGITMPSTLAHIGDEAFKGCINLAELKLSDNITSVGRYAFKDTAWLNNQPDGLIYINKVAYIFKGDMKVDTEIELKAGTTAIADYAFADCMRLRQIILPESLISIGAYAFASCYGLREASLPNSITEIGTGAFKNCIFLQSITLPQGLTKLADNLFSGCELLSAINLTESIISIGEYTFEGCKALMSLTLPKNLVSIGDYAFYNCTNLRNIHIGLTVLRIGVYVFYNCNNLTITTAHKYKPTAWADTWNPSDRPVEWGK